MNDFQRTSNTYNIEIVQYKVQIQYYKIVFRSDDRRIKVTL
jgi:hypothetical protein